MNLPQKHSATGTTIFTVMSALAAEHGAINLSQGFPDFSIDQHLADSLSEAVLSGMNQYAPMPGLPSLKEAVAMDISSRYGITVNAHEEVTITPGATYGIYTAFSAVLQAGDEAIIFEPAYDSYIPNIEMNGAKAIPVPLKAPFFTVDWQLVKDAITPKTKAIIVNTPNNPTGAIWTKEDWLQLAELVRGTDIVILSDEVYEQLVYDGNTHLSVLQIPELRERSFALYSFGKVFNNTGWKIGYCIAPPAFTKAFRAIHQFVSFTVNTPGQYAIARHLVTGKSIETTKMMTAKRTLFLDLLKRTKFKIHQPTQGSYFQIADYSSISDMPDMDFARWLTIEHGVATIPVSAFYKNKKDDKLIRFCFAKKEETLISAIDKLKQL